MGMYYYITMKMLSEKKNLAKKQKLSQKSTGDAFTGAQALWVVIHCKATLKGAEVVTLLKKCMNTTTILKSQHITGAKPATSLPQRLKRHCGYNWRRASVQRDDSTNPSQGEGHLARQLTLTHSAKRETKQCLFKHTHMYAHRRKRKK